ncbi:hypothetical protein HZC09_02730 [Candidatus Micrarchaeota archaeon]|nr:hypothetical protein [Candidatus Micrarchaeota archaeon]
MAAGISCSIIFADAFGRKLQEKVPQDAAIKLALPLHKTIPLEEEEDFWKLTSKLQKHVVKTIKALEELPLELKEAVQKHFDSYCWIECYENDPVWTKEAFAQRIEAALKENAGGKVKEARERHEKQEKEIGELAAEYKIDKEFLKQFRRAMFDRILGESLIGLGNYGTKGLFAAIAKRVYLPLNHIKWFSDEELFAALRGERDASELIKVLQKRQKHYLVALAGRKTYCFDGDDADEILRRLDIEKPQRIEVNEVKGVSAYPGKAVGTARVVLDVEEVDKVKHGDILVTKNTTPSFILAMKRSAAIVTDEGGITCHAAIVSRELGIPCIIGTKAGTALIPDGSKIEVDATGGTVRIIEK